ncbi:MAG: UDP-N-acetylmuramoyl-L-alanine--D-glutamate ligase [Chlorobia bacterium]|nr:UDP-N-acetylmuramoyl-L-alanine--D-glutamate ligase [Fimbriimonadaceae bacterium]
MHVNVFGLGRSGLAIAKAAVALGGSATIYDQSSPAKLAKPEILEDARALGAEVLMDWDGVLPPCGPLEGVGSVGYFPNPPQEKDDADPFGEFGDTPKPPQGGLLPWLVVNPAVDMRSPILKAAQDQGYEILSEIEFAYRISKAPIIAITGTNGKSTTTVMTYLCLKQCGIDAVLCGNILGSGYPEVPLTEAALNSHPEQILVAEISSFQLEWVKHFRPLSAGITNIWPDHLDRYDSFEQYAATKQRIFSAQTAGDFAIVKANDPVVRAPGVTDSLPRTRRTPTSQPPPPLGKGERELIVLTFGATGEHARVDERFLTVLDKQIKLDELHFTEHHNHANASMAALIAYGALKGSAGSNPKAKQIIEQAKLEADQKRAAKTNAYNQRLQEANKPEHILPSCILEGLKEFRGIAHRMEFVGEKGGVRVINNSMCTNPDAVLKSATSLKGPNHVLVGGRNKGLDFRPLKHYFSNRMHHAYVYGEARNKLSEQIGTDLVYEKMEDAARAALDAARSGEVVMLAPGCASTDQYRDFRDRGDVFKQLAKEWLEI